MRRSEQALIYGVDDGVDHAPLQIEPDDWNVCSHDPEHGFIVLRSAQLVKSRPDKVELVAGGLQLHGDRFAEVFHDADACDHGRWVHRALRRFVVEAHIAGDYGDRQLLVNVILQIDLLAGLGKALHTLPELPEGFRLLRVAIVQAVGEGGWSRADACHVSHGLGHGCSPAPVGADSAVEGIGVHTQGQAELLSPDRRNQSGVCLSRPDHGTAHDLGIIVSVDMLPGGDVGGVQDLEEDLVVVRRLIEFRLGLAIDALLFQTLVADACG